MKYLVRFLSTFLYILILFSSFQLGYAKTKYLFSTSHNIGIETNYQIGKVFKHTDGFLPTINGISNVIQVSAFKQTTGNKAWQRKLKYPEIGGGFSAILHHNKDTIGNGFAAFSYFTYPIVRSRIVDFIFRFCGGLAYTTKTYDATSNPIHNALAMPINIFVEARLGLHFKVHQNAQIITGISFSHYSSGGIKLPNLGINTPTFTLGVRYLPTPKKLEINRDTIPKVQYKNEIGFLLNAGLQDITKFEKDKSWLVYGTSIQYARHFNIVNKLYTGALVEFDFGYPNLNVNKDKVQDKIIQKAATRFSIYVGNEISFGRTSIFYALGAYLYTPYKMFLPIYFKIGTNINFLALEKKNRPYLNIGVKAHGGTAQYSEMGIGSNFKF
jgi:hypothetical protein